MSCRTKLPQRSKRFHLKKMVFVFLFFFNVMMFWHFFYWAIKFRQNILPLKSFLYVSNWTEIFLPRWVKMLNSVRQCCISLSRGVSTVGTPRDPRQKGQLTGSQGGGKFKMLLGLGVRVRSGVTLAMTHWPYTSGILSSPGVTTQTPPYTGSLVTTMGSQGPEKLWW